MSEIGIIIDDLNSLMTSAHDDMEKGIWSTYPPYIEQFNQLLARARSIGIRCDLEPIQQVPRGNLGHLGEVGMGTEAEKAKIREIVQIARRLLRQIERKREINT